jgi:16S rRNA (cytosine967-C5)-methyltransferase
MPADPRRAAARAIDRTLGAGAPLDAVLARESSGLGESDAALCRELAFGTVRWVRRLDHVIEGASQRRARQIDRRLLTALRLGAYQLLFLDRVPAYAAVNESVETVRRDAGGRAAGFANSVLRRIAERPGLSAWPVEVANPVARLGIESSHPDYLVRRWMARWGEAATRRLLDANNAPRPLQLLAFADRGGRDRLAADLAAEGVTTEPTLLSLFGLTVRCGDPFHTAAFERGDLYVQDSASQAAAWMPAVQPGERVFDACAAPGGKSFAILAAQPSARVVAADRSPSRLDRVQVNQRRLGRRFPLLAADGGVTALRGESFDRVLLDLPCSGTGTLRQHPELKWRITEREIARLAADGRRMVEAAAPLVRPGGWLVVVTCALEPEENESMVDAFLASHAEFRLGEMGGQLPACVSRGIFGRGRWRLLTEADHDGFTVHALEKL